ncbi:MAG TPA: GNAT family N-acetyltransferase [Actinomycetota bacterium]|nr:GNAT family N-acetyltransferase [Actinomycetota bacterium]
MTLTAVTSDVTRAAAEAASDAAARAGVEVLKLKGLEEIQQAVELHRVIWGPEDRDLIGVSTLRALSHADNYVFGAYLGDRLVAAITGFVGWHEEKFQLHSHILGVSPEVQGRNVGFALKEHQRAWCLSKEITTVTWTYDPLVSRNAYFNLTKLGAAVTAYYPSFYGQMNDGINGSDDSDRVLVEWALGSPRAVEASLGDGIATPDIAELREAGAEIALDAGPDGSPIETTASSDTILVGIPRDIVEIRRRNAELGSHWRSASRSALEGRLNDGFVITALAKPGYYVLERVS